MHCSIITSMVTSVLALVAHTSTTVQASSGCQMDNVKMHAYHACDYFAEQLHEDHYRVTARQNSRRRRQVQTLMDAAPATTEELAMAQTERKHHFKTRYSRPTHISIRHLTDAYLVMDYPYAKILRKHSSHQYKIMPSHFHSQNGTLERQHHVEEQSSEQSSSPQSISSSEGHQHHHHAHRIHHRNHLKHTVAVTSNDDALSEPRDDGNQADNVVRRRRSRDIHVAVSACCRDIEKCIHTMCPMR